MPAEATAAAPQAVQARRATPIASPSSTGWPARCAAPPSPPPAPPRAAGDPVVALGAAGHVLDFDDTYLPGIAHLSAPVAPAALVLGAHTNATVAEVLAAYAEGFEAMGALAAAGHPALYDRGWHPTAVCGAVGAAVAAAALLGADRDTAAALAALRAGGLRAAFGSDGKSIQVGLAAATGVAAAKLAAAGATAPAGRIAAAWRDAYGGEWDTTPADAISRNWIKAWPCCLQTHGAIECARADRRRARRPADRARPPGLAPGRRLRRGRTPLQAKFSIPYTTAFTLLHGGPRVDDFAALDPEAQRLSSASPCAPTPRSPSRSSRCSPATRSSRASTPPAARRSTRCHRTRSPPRSTSSPATASTTSPATSRRPS